MTAYLAPFWEVRIHDVLRNRVGVLTPPTAGFVTAVSVSLMGAKGDGGTISVSIDAPYEEGIKLLEDTAFNVGNGLEIRIGWADGWVSKPFFGWLSEGGVGLSITPNGVTGTFTAQIIGRAATIVPKGDMLTVSEAIDYLKRGAPELGVITFTKGAEEELAKAKGLFVQRGSMQMLLDELTRIAFVSYQFSDSLVEPGMTISAVRENSAKSPKYRFVMRGRFDRANGTYPLISYDPEIKSGQFYFINPAAKGLTVLDVNDKGEVVTTEAKPGKSGEKTGQKDPQETASKDTQAETADGEKKKGERKLTASDYAARWVGRGGDHPQATKDQVAQSIHDRASRDSGWNASALINGNPDIYPFEMCLVDGVGRMFDGSYQINSVVHQLAGGKFETTLSLFMRRIESSVGGAKDEVEPAKEGA